MTALGILLILGPSGVGKSSVIDELLELDTSILAVAAYTTRPPRSGDRYRLSVTRRMFEILSRRERLLAQNDLFGFRYGTPRAPILTALASGRSVVADCPVAKVGSFEEAFPGRLFRVYLEPPSPETLRGRLSDGRDPEGQRLAAALAELDAVERGEFDQFIDVRLVNMDGAARTTALRIYENWRHRRSA